MCIRLFQVRFLSRVFCQFRLFKNSARVSLLMNGRNYARKTPNSKLRSAFTRITTIGFGAEGKLNAQPVQEVQGPEFKTCWNESSERLLVSKLSCSYTHWRVYITWRHALSSGGTRACQTETLGSNLDACKTEKFLAFCLTSWFAFPVTASVSWY